MSQVRKIVIVCTGNSCRSVMAAGVLKSLLKGKPGYKILTAGTAAMKGMPPTPEVIRIMSEHNIDVSAHRSSPLTEEIIEDVDIILVMERRHKDSILYRWPELKDKVHLLSEFGRIENEKELVDPNIPDPIGKPPEFYRRVFEIIREGVMRTVNKLEEG